MKNRSIYKEKINNGLTYSKYIELTEKYIEHTDVKNLKKQNNKSH